MNPHDPSMYSMQQATLAAAERTATALERIADALEGKAAERENSTVHRTTLHHRASDDTYQVYCTCRTEPVGYFAMFSTAQQFIRRHTGSDT